ncbi:class I SAM-dependent methyltransferase [Novibacillus thermophilus]|uniref:SAM-dependent methyltransferase n=1 Tax=Novibacillus thermophilus TaxID=1471761 RepID=A0A1U9K6N6_9BACL|nr:class I SAM-dependent methyltransferase [Novibacillus thermophilus]AQS55729.1 SAM-dependent methyltransferase [Novibacillus thermophilus]
MGKWFPRWYDALMEPLERRGIRNIRIRLLQKAWGNVLEIGSGTGLNFPYYEQVEQVTAIDPEPLMVKQSMQRAEQAHVPIRVRRAEAEALPFADNLFDTAVGTLVLCTVPDPNKALAEIRRVCKPGAPVLFFEHVRLEHPLLGRLQDGLTPVWKRLCDGCHLNRNTLEQIQRAGFKTTVVEPHYKGIFLVIEAVNEKDIGKQ